MRTRCFALLLWLCAVPVLAAQPRLERLADPAANPTIEHVRAATAVWEPVPEGWLRRQPAPSWWRVTLPAAPESEGDWVLALKEAYDAELTAYVAPDYRPRRIATFDPAVTQIGSRHRLAVPLPAGQLDQPVYLRLVGGRAQPIRLAAAPLEAYVADDLRRLRITSAMLSAQILLGLVAAIFAVALRRWMLLLFAGWVASAVIYLLVLSGEITSWLPALSSRINPMAISGVTINLGLICAYLFVLSFLDIGRHYPRLALAFRLLIGGCAVLTVLALLMPADVLISTGINLMAMALAALALGTGLARILAGSPQGWFYLAGWGSVSAIGMVHAGYFLRRLGTPDWLEIANPAISTVGALVLVLATARAARYAEREMHAARAVARTDPLTGVPNRAQLDLSLPALLHGAEQTGQPLCLLFIDLDHFKRINDRHGHAVGDACLAQAARTLRGKIRSSDLLARYGGEEFVLVLPGATREHASVLAESLRAAIEQDSRRAEHHAVPLTVSIGLATYRPGEPPDALLARADAALYRAKHAGRNQVAGEDAPVPAIDDAQPA